jgi:hypothetical protein
MNIFQKIHRVFFNFPSQRRLHPRDEHPLANKIFMDLRDKNIPAARLRELGKQF